MTRSFAAALAAFALVTAGCTHDPFRGHHYKAPPPPPVVLSNLAPLKLDSKPLIRTFRLPTTDFSVYQTFALVPSSRVGIKNDLNEFEEAQLQFFIGSQLESKGYTQVSDADKPQLLVAVAGTTKLEEQEIPPQLVEVPEWVPGQTYTVREEEKTRYGYGNPVARTETEKTVTTGGYFRTKTEVKPGYKVSKFITATSVTMFDAKSGKRLFLGVGSGSSQNSDIRVASQLVNRDLMRDLPEGGYRDSSLSRPLGMELAVYTVNGNDFVPTVTDVPKDSAAAKAGLRPEDFIRSVDGRTIKNLNHRKVAEVLGANRPLELEIIRGPKVMKLVVNATPTTATSEFQSFPGDRP